MTFRVEVVLPVDLVNTANVREHWAARARRAKAQRQSVRFHVDFLLSPKFELRHGNAKAIHVTITRWLGKGQRAFDSDGMQSACKAVRDGVADAVGIDDGDARYVWEYLQEQRSPRHVRGEVSIRIEVTT